MLLMVSLANDEVERRLKMSWFKKIKKSKKDIPCFTLVDNDTKKSINFWRSDAVVEHLVKKYDYAKEYIENLVNQKLEEKEKAKDKESQRKSFIFYLDRKVAAPFLNLIDASEYSYSWNVKDGGVFEKDGLVRIEYDADRQLLFQTKAGVIFEG